MILIAIYTTEVFSFKEFENSEPIILDLIGISLDKNEGISDRLLKYLPYMSLLIVLVLTHYVINSNRYDVFIQQNLLLEIPIHT